MDSQRTFFNDCGWPNRPNKLFFTDDLSRPRGKCGENIKGPTTKAQCFPIRRQPPIFDI
jgi:hypothetical protein